MVTWNAESPTALPPLALSEKARGAVRLVAVLVLTLVALGLFLLGHNLRRLMGHRIVTFHFGAARFWARAGLWLMGLRHEVEGEAIGQGAMMANHGSWIDIFALRAVRLIYFVSKAEVADWPGVGFITRVTGTVFIERRRAEAKRQEAVLRERIAARQVLCIFPEGTSTDGQRVLPFKSSLFSAFFDDSHGVDVWVQPVSIRYVVGEGTGLPANFYGWWGDMGFEAHIWDVLCRSRRGRARVRFHEAVRPADFPDRKALAEYCGRVVAEGHRDASQG